MNFVSLNVLLSILFLLLSAYIGEAALQICRDQNALFKGIGIEYNAEASLSAEKKENLEKITLDELPFEISAFEGDRGPLVKRLYQEGVLQPWTSYNFKSLNGAMDYLFEDNNYEAISTIITHMIDRNYVESTGMCNKSDYCDPTIASSLISQEDFLVWVDKLYFVRSERFAERKDMHQAIMLWREGLSIVNKIDTDWGEIGVSDTILDKAVIVGTFLEANPKPTPDSVQNRILALTQLSSSELPTDMESLPFSARAFVMATIEYNEECYHKGDEILFELIQNSQNQGVTDLLSFVRIRNRFLHLRDYRNICEAEVEEWNSPREFIQLANQVVQSQTLRQGYKTDIDEMKEYIGAFEN